MPDIEWGSEIPVNGKRPEWLTDTDLIQWRWGSANDDEWHEKYAPYGLPAASVSIENGCAAIRLPASHPYYATPPQTPDVPPEVVERALALVKRMASREKDAGGALNITEFLYTADGIVALMEPVDPDEAEARKLNDSSPYDLTGLDAEHAARNVRYIGATILAAIKRGRELQSAPPKQGR